MNQGPELRQNPVSGDWVLVAPARARRPNQFKIDIGKATPKKDCPFEDPQKAGNGEPLEWYTAEGARGKGPLAKTWSLQVIPNKYPFVTKHKGVCPTPPGEGLARMMAAVGFHEVVIPRGHNTFLADMKPEEAELIIRAYQDRILAHKDEDCLDYVLVFHNHGAASGASIWHPHSQILALPFVPHDVRQSVNGSRAWFEKKATCVHCEIIAADEISGERLVYHNKEFVIVVPYAPSASFELRIFPRDHGSHFEEITPEQRLYLADALTAALRRLKKVIGNVPYNFFIHTAPVDKQDYRYYHWHLEIEPKTSIFGGVEHGAGIRVIEVAPEAAAEYLRGAQ
ncbi:MAG: galactose-1-phosphate uridylyltransferase [Patescibacteria group bacterium]|mgnify:CR=1 FL=1